MRYALTGGVLILLPHMNSKVKIFWAQLLNVSELICVHSIYDIEEMRMAAFLTAKKRSIQASIRALQIRIKPEIADNINLAIAIHVIDIPNLFKYAALFK